MYIVYVVYVSLVKGIFHYRSAFHGSSPYVAGLTALQTWNYNIAGGLGHHQVKFCLQLKTTVKQKHYSYRYFVLW